MESNNSGDVAAFRVHYVGHILLSRRDPVLLGRNGVSFFPLYFLLASGLLFLEV